MAAATAESTPPERPQMARPVSPICSRIRSICSSTMLTIVQVGRQPAMSCRKCSSTFWPCSVCSTSGCHWTPASRRVGVLERGHGGDAVEASTVKPSGAAGTESPCDIHTLWVAGRSPSSVPGSRTVTGVRPYSRAPLWATSPPRPWAISWKP